MRFPYSAVAALLAAVATAQMNNAISITGSTLSVTAGQPLSLTWTNPSDGTVTIKLQQDPITPDGGAVLASGIDASALGATVQIPEAADVNSHLYTIEIIDDTNASNMNFSPNFGIQGATGTATGVVTGSASSTGTASITSGTTVVTLTSSATDSTITNSSGTTITTSTSSDSSASTTSSDQSSSTSSSASSTDSTSVPNSNDSNGAGSLKIQGGLLAMAIGLIAVV